MVSQMLKEERLLLALHYPESEPQHQYLGQKQKPWPGSWLWQQLPHRVPKRLSHHSYQQDRATFSHAVIELAPIPVSQISMGMCLGTFQHPAHSWESMLFSSTAFNYMYIFEHASPH